MLSQPVARLIINWEEKCGISATSLEPFIYDTTSADQPWLLVIRSLDHVAGENTSNLALPVVDDLVSPLVIDWK
jgi:hypothetical protein